MKWPNCVSIASVKVVTAREADIPSWLEIVREVEPLFGHMPDFERTLQKNIARGTAYCIRNRSGQVLGGMLLRTRLPYEIGWLAVRAVARRQGIGRALVEEALRRLPPPCEVSVVTFGEDNKGGHAARRIYEAAGFRAAETLPRGPEGGTAESAAKRRSRCY